MHSNVRAAESAYGLAMHVAEHLFGSTIQLHFRIITCTLTITCHATHVPRVLHFSAFIIITNYNLNENICECSSAIN